MVRNWVLPSLFIFAAAGTALAGPYTEAGIPAGSNAFVGWATSVANLTRGRQQINSTLNLNFATVGTAASAIGPANGTDVVSLGDGGSITVNFANPITNGGGNDFAVFENGFFSPSAPLIFAELGYVAVSSDGTDFFTFPSVSLTQTTTQVGSFGAIDQTNVHNLAGKDIANVGTGFNLDDLIPQALLNPTLLDLSNIVAVRVTDVVGSITDVGGGTPFRDSLGNAINEPFPTPFASSGFDFDALGVINATPEPTSLTLLLGIGAMTSARRRFTK